MWFLRGWFLCFTGFIDLLIIRGIYLEMAEWSKAPVLKTGGGLFRPRVHLSEAKAHCP
ncbi:hypothetical protein [Photobacterium sanguinicancri]|uniref:hypothetical protein n=1 Tax=Photobacterium sanguinicancri TaxID=875932 RepID=UPI000B26A4CF|nr:hypothetical protein [Photobacterium sanguinicancri]